MADEVIEVDVATLAGETLATVTANAEDTGLSFALRVARLTKHSHFSLVLGALSLPQDRSSQVFPLLRGATANSGNGERLLVTLINRDPGTLVISGIPEDATFGGHGSACACVGEGKLSQLNGAWEPVPLLEVRGMPVWQKDTALQLVDQFERPVTRDDGKRYIALAEDGVLNIHWLLDGVPDVHGGAGFPWSERHGFICAPEGGEPFLALQGQAWQDAVVYLALTRSLSFLHVIPHAWNLGANVPCGRASLVPRARGHELSPQLSEGTLQVDIVTVGGRTLATQEAAAHDTGRTFALRVAAATGQSHFTLLAGSVVIPQDPKSQVFGLLEASRKLQATAAGQDADAARAVVLTLLSQDPGIIVIEGIPPDATFGGHGSATGHANEARLGELNGNWLPLPVVQVRGSPVWYKDTALRNMDETGNAADGDNGRRYLALDEECGILNIRWVHGYTPLDDVNVGSSADRHGWISPPQNTALVGPSVQAWEGGVVYLALKESQSFPDAYPLSWRLGRNCCAGRACVIRPSPDTPTTT